MRIVLGCGCFGMRGFGLGDVNLLTSKQFICLGQRMGLKGLFLHFEQPVLQQFISGTGSHIL